MAKRKSRPARKARPARRVSRRKTAPRSTFKARRGPETLRLRAASPNLTVDDLERSLRFYRDALGFIEKERWKNDKGATLGVMLLAGRCELGLSQDDWAKGRGRKKGVGFSVSCETAQDVDALARRVKEAGFALASEPKDEWGVRGFSVDDPDGFRLYVYREK